MPNILEQVPESHQDLLQSPLTATLTTIDAAGRPQSTAVWFLLDTDGQLKGSITADRQKYTNLSGNAHCDLFIIDPKNTQRTLEVRAEAALTADPEKAFVRQFAQAYGVPEEMLLAAGDDRYTVTFHPRRIVTNPPAQR
jgi:PPOX class probable F420-dependent enzyme